MTTRLEKRQLRTIIRKLIANDKTWLNLQEIMWSEKGDYWILNYVPGGRNEYNRLCRGLVVRKDLSNWSASSRLKTWFDPCARIASFPFIRFHNYEEVYVDASGKKHKATIDFINSEMIEKLDGTMVGVFFPYGDYNLPEFHTRRMLSTYEPDMQMGMTSFHSSQTIYLMQLIKSYIRDLKFNENDTQMTYIFEFIHESTRVLTNYSKAWNGLWLLGARNIRTHKEIIDQNELDKIAFRMGCRRPIVFKNTHDNMEKILDIMEQRARDVRDFEGVVFLDNKGNRLKLKRAQYVALHHLLGEISYKHLVPRILQGEEEEIVSYFASAKPLIQNFKQHYKNFWAKVASRVIYWRDRRLDRKSLAIQIFKDRKETDAFIQSQIMDLFQEESNSEIWRKIDAELKAIALGDEKRQGSPKRLLEIIELKEIE